VMRHTALFSSAGPTWAIVWNRGLAEGLSSVVYDHIGAMTRKQALRAQQMTFCSAGQSPYMRARWATRRPPC
jgi:hypothetical protein